MVQHYVSLMKHQAGRQMSVWPATAAFAHINQSVAQSTAGSTKAAIHLAQALRTPLHRAHFSAQRRYDMANQTPGALFRQALKDETPLQVI